MKYQLSFLFIIILTLNSLFAQNASESVFHKWGISAHIGANTVSTNSSHASFLNANWSLGVVRNLQMANQSFKHRVKLKIQAFNEKLSNLPYYSLDQNDNLLSSTYTSKSFYSMVYLGWGVDYILPIKSKALSIRGDVGFNYLLPARYSSIYTDGSPKGTQSYGRPYNFFLTRPEISIGLGYKLKLGDKQLIIAPFYSYNFTIQYLNLVPSFHTAGLQTTLNF